MTDLAPRLVLAPNLDDPDGFYAALIAAHQGLGEEASALLNARLVMLLANQVGNVGQLREALELARAGLAPPEAEAG